MRTLLIIFIFSSLFYLNLSKTKEEWKSRVIYQVLTDRFAHGDGSRPNCDVSKNTYCGGNFLGIQNNLDYIQGLGATAIWISPIVKNTDNGFHGYWAQDFYTINPYFGTEQDLINLTTACHARDIWVMIGVVANHVGPVGTDYSSIVPFNSAEYYHDYCVISQSDFTNNQNNVENCRLAELPDLKQENQYVHDTLISWVRNLVTKYNADGIRIDTIPEVPKSFWKEFVAAAGVFQIGEVFDGRIAYVSDYQNYIDATLNYPLYFNLKNVFLYNYGMNTLESFYNSMTAFPDQSVLGVFSDNHDNARFLSINSDYVLFKSYLAFNLGAIGIPIIYYGSEQGYAGTNDPYNREALWTNLNTGHELYTFIKTITAARAKTQWYSQTQVQRYSDTLFYAFTRGTNFFAFTNQKNQVVRTITYHPYTNGQIICNIFYPTADCITIQNNQFTVYLNSGEIKIYVLKTSASFLSE